MNDDDWQILQAAFEAAVAATGTERERLVNAFAAEHPKLAADLHDLLQADRASDADLVAPVATAVEELADQQYDPWINRVIGAWTVRERIAQGGMGAVFLAERSDETYEQAAAVKVMAAQLVGSDAIERFKSERQILANLDHPYIAKLIDGGSMDDGLPYLVMDYVDGLPIDQHCDTQALGMDGRLDLFCKVCDAVDYAHRNLIVHRDLKPSNILVDGNGNPRLLDFGIAKLLGADSLRGDPALTQVGARILTPQYASPEQVRGEPVTVATDVYSLGVVLYWLMTGQSPYGRTHSTPLEMEQAVVEHTPARPSTVVTTPDTEHDALARFGVSAQRLSRRLDGDLDNIALKTLQKEPARRYPSAAALAEDVRRYRRNEPVSARGDAWSYVAGKFVARHARSLTVAALVVAGVAAQTVFYTQRLKAERDRANLAATQSQEVAGFLENLFDSASPHTAKGSTPTAIDMLELGVEDIDELSEQPQLQAELKRIMGNSFLGLGDVARARELLIDALATKTSTATDELNVAEAYNNLSEAHRHFGDLKDAEREMRVALEIRERVLPADDELLHFTLARLGVILFDQGRVPEGIDVEQRALDAMIAAGRGETSAAIDIRGNLANALDNVGRTDEAGAMHRETVELSQRVDGAMDPNTVIRMANYGLWLNRQGDYEGSRAQFQDCLDRSVDIWPPEKDIIAFFEGGLGSALIQLGRLDEALAAYQRAEQITLTGLGKTSPRYLKRVRGLARVYLQRNELAAADAILTEGRALASTLDVADSFDGVQVQVLSGRLAAAQGNAEQAVAWLSLTEEQLARISARARLSAQRDLGSALSAAGRFDEAESVLTRALADIETATAPGHLETASFIRAVIAHYQRAGSPERAVAASEALVAQWEKIAEPNWQVALALGAYAAVIAPNERARAAAIWQRIEAVLTAVFGADDPRVESLRNKLG